MSGKPTKSTTEPPQKQTTCPAEKATTEKATGATTSTVAPPLFPQLVEGKRPDYGTNNTLELLERIPSQMVELKLDDVLTAVKTVDNLCDYARCKARTSLMGQDCEHCRKRFCFKHALPEVHGCGEAVKKDERKKFMHPKTAKTLREEKELTQAKKKLQEKLKDMQVARMQKTGGGGGGAGAGGAASEGASRSGAGGARRKK